jgi:hypothetical protein
MKIGMCVVPIANTKKQSERPHSAPRSYFWVGALGAAIRPQPPRFGSRRASAPVRAGPPWRVPQGGSCAVGPFRQLGQAGIESFHRLAGSGLSGFADIPCPRSQWEVENRCGCKPTALRQRIMFTAMETMHPLRNPAFIPREL